MPTQKKVAPSAATAPSTESRLEDFAEDLGHLLGNAQNKAESWLGQRKQIAEQLTHLRDTANRLLQELGTAAMAGAGRRRGRPRKDAAAPEFAPAPLSKMQRRKKRTMSAEAREKIAAAQRARWAKQKRAAKG